VLNCNLGLILHVASFYCNIKYYLLEESKSMFLSMQPFPSLKGSRSKAEKVKFTAKANLRLCLIKHQSTKTHGGSKYSFIHF